MQELIAQITLLNSEVADRNIEDSDAAIRLTTVHQAKGLEYDVVFLIGAAENLFPIRRAVEAGDTEEERRLFYVAVTRARDELYLLFPKMNTKGGPSMSSASRSPGNPPRALRTSSDTPKLWLEEPVPRLLRYSEEQTVRTQAPNRQVETHPIS